MPDAKLRTGLWRVLEDRGFAERDGRGALHLTDAAHALVESWSKMLHDHGKVPKPGGQLESMQWLGEQVGEDPMLIMALLHVRAHLWKWETDRERVEQRMSRQRD